MEEPRPLTLDEACQSAADLFRELQACERAYDALKAHADAMAAALKWDTDPDNYSEDSWDVVSVIDPPDYGEIGATGGPAIDAYRKWQEEG